MPKLKLSYFDFDGGRGEPARLIMRLNAVEFEDNRIPVSSWPDVKKQFPYQQVPVLEVDGKVLTQSNAINRLLGKLTGMYPEELWQAAVCDEIMDAVEDIVQLVVNTFFLEEEDKRQQRELLVANQLPMYLRHLNAQLEDSGGEYFCDHRLTITDLKVYTWTTGLQQGHLDYIPTSIVKDQAPSLFSHQSRIAEFVKHNIQ